MNDESRKEIAKKREGPRDRRQRVCPEAKEVVEKWPLEEISYDIELLMMAYLPDRINKTKIYETLVAGPTALDDEWFIILMGRPKAEKLEH